MEAERMNPPQQSDMARSLLRRKARRSTLQRRVKPMEVAMQLLLLGCGLLSILTTLGIVVVLGKESVAFFTRDQWVNTNRSILSDMDESSRSLRVEPGKELGAIAPGGTIRIGQEVMEVVAFHNNRVSSDIVGTGGGFKRWCASEAELGESGHARPQIVNASRAISAYEREACAAFGYTPLAFHIGTDALALVVSAQNDFLRGLGFEELRRVFSGAQLWSDIRSDYPEQPIQLIIPGTASGSFDFFVEAVLQGDASSLLAQSPLMSENDKQLIGSIQRNPYSIGFFGFAYYLNHADDLRLLTLDGVEPSAATVEDGSYGLLRPLYIYSDEGSLGEQPQLRDFLWYYIERAPQVIVDVGYFPAAVGALDDARREWLRVTGAAAAPTIVPARVLGELRSAGSSTVYPLTQRIAEDFLAAGYLPKLDVRRGIRGEHTVAPHRAGVAVEYNDRPTLGEFFTKTSWIPAIGEFGVIPLINATLMTSTIAMLVALPLGIGAAIYLSEYASPRVRSTLKPLLEVLAGIPTVVYGYFALTFMTPLLRGIFGVDVVNIYNTGSAGIVVGILIIPLVSSMSEDALHAVPHALREASYGLGATKLETVLKVVVPAALSGILAAFIVAVSRAIGETMIVAIAAGAGPNFSFDPFDSAETMTGHIARISGGDLSYDSIDYNSIFAIGLTLFVITFLLNVLSRAVISRFREEY